MKFRFDMRRSTILRIARQEFTIALRSRWLIVFALVFGVLTLGLALFGARIEGLEEIQSFSRTAISILNLVLYVVPLAALLMGALGFSTETGGAELLFSQPLRRSWILAGKLLGLWASLSMATLIGFGAAGIFIAGQVGGEGAGRYAIVVGLCVLMIFIFLALAGAITLGLRDRMKSVAAALFVWFFFVVLYDLLVMGGVTLLHGTTANRMIFLSLFGNPVDLVRVAGLIALGGKHVFGASGAMLLRFLGGPFASAGLLLVVLLLWIFVPYTLAGRRLRKLDI
jgi:Cu-processing system permease protein